MRSLFPLLFAIALISACSAPQTRLENTRTVVADTLYVNGTVWTGVADQEDATQLAVKDGQVVYVGDGFLTKVIGAEQVDLQGQFMMPGFIDNHVHFIDGGAALASVELRDAATRQAFVDRIQAFAATRKPGEWVRNGNWDHTLWGGELPHRNWIDAVTGETPVFITRLDGHMALANTAALKLAGITSETPTPAGGEIVRDADGSPTGVLKDNAMLLVGKVIPEPTLEERFEVIRLAQEHAFANGLTQVHAMSVDPSEVWLMDVLRNSQQAGLLKLRVKVFGPIQRWPELAEQIVEHGRGDATLSWGGFKGLVDGSLGSATAWFYEPYVDAPTNSGFPLIQPSELRGYIADIDKIGLPMAIHGIGDKAIDELLAAMLAVGGEATPAKRFRIEHFQHPSAHAIQELAQHGVIAAAHPYHAIDDGRWLEDKIGPERAKTTYAFKSILDAGGILSFGSDWPVAPLAPLAGVHAAVTRATIDGKHPDGWQPQEKITVEQALVAYTRTNAYAVFEEEFAGTLEPGKRADFVVLAQDPRVVDPERIKDIKVRVTAVDGEVVFGDF